MLKVPEQTVAELHRILAEDRRRVGAESREYDVLSNYHFVKHAG